MSFLEGTARLKRDSAGGGPGLDPGGPPSGPPLPLLHRVRQALRSLCASPLSPGRHGCGKAVRASRVPQRPRCRAVISSPEGGQGTRLRTPSGGTKRVRGCG